MRREFVEQRMLFESLGALWGIRALRGRGAEKQLFSFLKELPDPSDSPEPLAWKYAYSQTGPEPFAGTLKSS